MGSMSFFSFVATGVTLIDLYAAQDLYCAVALELLQQAARALERSLLDGGPCRW
jgi:hypothetical protein